MVFLYRNGLYKLIRFTSLNLSYKSYQGKSIFLKKYKMTHFCANGQIINSICVERFYPTLASATLKCTIS